MDVPFFAFRNSVNIFPPRDVDLTVYSVPASLKELGLCCCRDPIAPPILME